MGKKTTKGMKKTKLRRKLKQLLAEHNALAAYEEAISLIDEYDDGMLRRLTRYRQLLQAEETVNKKRISDGLKLTIQHHGPITLDWVPSAAKRIFAYLWKQP